MKANQGRFSKRLWSLVWGRDLVRIQIVTILEVFETDVSRDRSPNLERTIRRDFDRRFYPTTGRIHREKHVTFTLEGFHGKLESDYGVNV